MKYTTVSLPEPLNKKIKKLIKKTGFPSTSAFVIFILREILANKTDVSPLVNKDKIMEQLKNLGYL
ncbi:MAG: CopG family transcriptional regulator [Patescibacteria group bacterium]|nr:CopG family transcriptional regulator [Patescibacteria group bacterium]MDE2015234.1 CopG family transcriptional regulator [Patescibacteria group bacterium]MDE2227040.1 CopG family transcriptional regulator [Patescibacteria group bacterium]